MNTQEQSVGFSAILAGKKGKIRLKLTFQESAASQINYLLLLNWQNKLKIIFRTPEELVKIVNINSFGGTSREVVVQFKMNKIDLDEFTSKLLDNQDVIENAEVVERAPLLEESLSVVNPEDVWQANTVREGSVKFKLGVLFYYKKNKDDISYEISIRRSGVVYIYARNGKGRISFCLDEKSERGYDMESFYLRLGEEFRCDYSWINDNLLKSLVFDKFHGVADEHKTLVELTVFALNRHFE